MAIKIKLIQHRHITFQEFLTSGFLKIDNKYYFDEL